MVGISGREWPSRLLVTIHRIRTLRSRSIIIKTVNGGGDSVVEEEVVLWAEEDDQFVISRSDWIPAEEVPDED
ncbi:unnamed protein product [Linum trigynum]|uniref:Uncharacterized protein n=1 Tax=Linum trigynum TaxID=586398 RepID=A0AAV2D5H3_9ROSI